MLRGIISLSELSVDFGIVQTVGEKKGEEYSSLVHYRTVIDGGFNLKKSLSTKTCDASFCTVVMKEAVILEMNQMLKQLSEGYKRVLDLIEKMK